MSRPAYFDQPVSVTVDLPGAFDSFFSGSGVAQGEDNYSEDEGRQHGANVLHRVYKARAVRKVGKGVSHRLTFEGGFHEVCLALDVLSDYTDNCRVANEDAKSERGSDAFATETRFAALAEITASHRVDERIQRAADSIYAQVGQTRARVLSDAWGTLAPGVLQVVYDRCSAEDDTSPTRRSPP